MSKIPNILHMIWVGDIPAPDYFYRNLAKWKLLMPSWEFKIWTNLDLTEVNIDSNYLKLINKTSIGAQKADLLRYYVVHKFGGFYVDADIIPERSLNELNIGNHDLILCHDLPWIDWAYIAIGFFGASCNHLLLEFVIQQMYNVDFNKLDIHLTTGPAALGNAYFNLKEKLNCIILPYWYFYRNKKGDLGPGEKNSQYGVYLTEDIQDVFGSHRYAATWNPKFAPPCLN